MDSSQLVLLIVFYGVIIEGKMLLSTWSGVNLISSADATRNKPRDKVVALILVVKSDNVAKAPQATENDSIETFDISDPNKSVSSNIDSSGDSNSEEYEDSEESEEVYNSTKMYDMYDYFENLDDRARPDKIIDESLILRKKKRKWSSCKKEGNKVCKQACVAASKNACAKHECKKKLKKDMKKQCKTVCKEFFMTD